MGSLTSLSTDCSSTILLKSWEMTHARCLTLCVQLSHHHSEGGLLEVTGQAKVADLSPNSEASAFPAVVGKGPRKKGCQLWLHPYFGERAVTS